MKRSALLLLSASVCCAAAVADPVITLTRFSCSRASDKVKIVYALADESAVVTMRLKRGGEPVDPSLYANAEGDVNRLVAAGNDKKIVWIPPVGFEFGDRDAFSVELKAWKTDAPPPYMVVNLTNNPVTVNYYAATNDFPLGFGNDYYKRAGLTLRKIPAAGRVFEMGCQSFYGTMGGCDTCRGFRHSVKLIEDYYIGVYEYTYGNKTAVEGKPGTTTDWPNASERFPSDTRNYPVFARAYTDIRCSTSDMSKGWPAEGHKLDLTKTTLLCGLRNKTGIEFDLPTEAQWWIACYGDGSMPFYNGGDGFGERRFSMRLGGKDTYVSSELDDYAWTAENSHITFNDADRVASHPVGLKKPNSYGLYDMIGNVAEWVLDGSQFDSGSSRFTSKYANEAVNGVTVDPKGFADPSQAGSTFTRLLMGGGYNFAGVRCSLNFRYVKEQTYTANQGDVSSSGNTYLESWVQGFRVACPATAIK